jgi:hypothetical protein
VATSSSRSVPAKCGVAMVMACLAGSVRVGALGANQHLATRARP